MIVLCFRARAPGFDKPHVRYAAYVRSQDLLPQVARMAFALPPEPTWKGKDKLLAPFYSFLPLAWAEGSMPMDEVSRAVYAAGQAAAAWSFSVLRLAFPEIADRPDLPMWLPSPLPDEFQKVEEPSDLAERRLETRRSIVAGSPTKD